MPTNLRTDNPAQFQILRYPGFPMIFDRTAARSKLRGIVSGCDAADLASASLLSTGCKDIPCAIVGDTGGTEMAFG